MKMKDSAFLTGSRVTSSLPGYIVFLILRLAHVVDSAQFKVVAPVHPVTATVGEEIMIPCHLSPRMNAASMEVRWFRSQFSSFVHLYLDGKDHTEHQMPEYQGRTALPKDAITNGSVALRIHQVRASDEGQYTCFVRSSFFYGEATLELNIAGVGSAPFISVEGHQAGGIRMICRTAGWYPEPEVLWTDSRGQRLPSLSETKSKGDSGLFETQTSVIVTRITNQNLSCCIKSKRLNQEKEATIHIADSFFPRVSPEMVLLYLFLVILLLSLLTLCILKKQGKLVAEFGWRRNLAKAAKVTLDPDTAHPELIVSEDRKSVRLSDAWQTLPDSPQRFDTFRCVLGREGFTAGRHYWEVEVGDGRYWWGMGVARESVKRKGWYNRSPGGGIWAVQRRGEKYQAYTDPVTQLMVSGNPRKIRVSLDYEGGRVTFFNAENKAPIFTFPPASFHGEKLFPYFWVGDTGSQLTLFL